MEKMHLFNTLSRKTEEFVPVNPELVTFYTCGPTVYDRKHIGNFRTYITADILLRVLKYNGYQVKYIMNITDVGHLTGDNLGDADSGEDRMVLASERERKTAWDVAKYYSDLFLKDFDTLGLTKPFKFTYATEHIKEQIKLIGILEKKGFTYQIDDGVYFDIDAYEASGKRYGELATMDELKTGARVEPNPQKKNPRDFALWRFSKEDENRDMEWDSPWGIGFPGWHIECSAMSLKYLTTSFESGEFDPSKVTTIDIHAGGEDLRQTHHPNEIVQSEGASGVKFVNYWVHGAHILIDGERMSTSKGNNYKVGDILEKEITLEALRYLYLTTNYRKILNFSWDSLEGAQKALEGLQVLVAKIDGVGKVNQSYEHKFVQAMNNDLDTPKALAILWEIVKDDSILPGDKLATVRMIDEVLGLDLERLRIQLSDQDRELVILREEARNNKDFAESDEIRKQFNERGIELEDTGLGTAVYKKI